jgi:hypothetical protein
LCILPIHPLANPILGQEDELRRDEYSALKINEMKDVNRYLSLSISQLGDKEREAIRARINNTIKKGHPLVLVFD